MAAAAGREFIKMSGSGNDFVMVDARTNPPGALRDPSVISTICAHGTGVGADGIVFLLPSQKADIQLLYLNSDGSVADLCGNATLCTTRLAVRLGAAAPAGMTIETGAGIIRSRILGSGVPEIDLQEVTDVRPTAVGISAAENEQRVGFAKAGIPHLVVEVSDVGRIDVVGRGRPLRSHPSLRADGGANVNFVSRQPGGAWSIRTYERGVEGETLACGTGAVASAILVSEWTGGTGPVMLQTKSGRQLTVRLERTKAGWLPSLSGEARFVFDGRLGEI
jgi:diaminopimelate epimerase